MSYRRCLPCWIRLADPLPTWYISTKHTAVCVPYMPRRERLQWDRWAMHTMPSALVALCDLNADSLQDLLPRRLVARVCIARLGALSRRFPAPSGLLRRWVVCLMYLSVHRARLAPTARRPVRLMLLGCALGATIAPVAARQASVGTLSAVFPAGCAVPGSCALQAPCSHWPALLGRTNLRLSRRHSWRACRALRGTSAMARGRALCLGTASAGTTVVSTVRLLLPSALP